MTSLSVSLHCCGSNKIEMTSVSLTANKRKTLLPAHDAILLLSAVLRINSRNKSQTVKSQIKYATSLLVHNVDVW